jgi:hypothetical protein
MMLDLSVQKIAASQQKSEQMSKVNQRTKLSRLLLLAFSVYHLMSQFSPPFYSKQASSSSSSSATPLGDRLFKTGLFICHAGVLTPGSSLNACCSLLFILIAVL